MANERDVESNGNGKEADAHPTSYHTAHCKNDERNVASNGKDGDGLLKAHPTAPWSKEGVASNGKDADTHHTALWTTRGMWQATARMPTHTQQSTL